MGTIIKRPHQELEQITGAIIGGIEEAIQGNQNIQPKTADE